MALKTGPKPDLRGLRVSIVGCGNAGLALAADLGTRGCRLSLYEPTGGSPHLDAIARSGVIQAQIDGQDEPFSVGIERAAGTLDQTLSEADWVLVAVPAFAHASVARKIAAHISAATPVVLFTGGLGALEFVAACNELERELDFPIVETSTLPYAARAIAPARIRILLRLARFSAGVFPSLAWPTVGTAFSKLFAQAELCGSILEPCLRNVNGVIHPAAVLLNVSVIENTERHPWFIWRDGITPGVARAIEAIDRERLAVAAEFGCQVPPIAQEQWSMGYGPKGTIRDTLRHSDVLKYIEGPIGVDHRFLTEDVPYFLSILIELARIAAVEARVMSSVASLAEPVIGGQLSGHNRTFARWTMGFERTVELSAYLASGPAHASRRKNCA